MPARWKIGARRYCILSFINTSMQISTYIIINLLYQKSVGNGEEGKFLWRKYGLYFNRKVKWIRSFSGKIVGLLT